MRKAFWAAMVAALTLSLLPTGPAAAAIAVSEIKYAYGDAAGSVVVAWRGAESKIEWGKTTAYGSSATAGVSAITPVDSPGPYREVLLTGLAADTDYHYRIGGGADHVLRSAPAGDFRWVDVGDTASSVCKTWMTQTHQLIGQLKPRFVTHGGDISEANYCGTRALHSYYTDQEAWSRSAAFQPSWGNHEYGHPASYAPAGTPRDSLDNYKGRGRVTNPQTLPGDTATTVKAPGCGKTVNTCRGEDWGWFRAGGVLFVSYPEIWSGALDAWRKAVDPLMAAAATDPAVDFVITYGHRPAYSSLSSNGWDPTVRAAISALAKKYAAANGKKYVINFAHHVHGLEVFKPIDGLTHITNATGGQGLAKVPGPVSGSVYQFKHLGVMAGDYEQAASKLTLRWVCGPKLPNSSSQNPCTYGATVWTTSFTR